MPPCVPGIFEEKLGGFIPVCVPPRRSCLSRGESALWSLNSATGSTRGFLAVRVRNWYPLEPLFVLLTSSSASAGSSVYTVTRHVAAPSRNRQTRMGVYSSPALFEASLAARVPRRASKAHALDALCTVSGGRGGEYTTPLMGADSHHDWRAEFFGYGGYWDGTPIPVDVRLRHAGLRSQRSKSFVPFPNTSFEIEYRDGERLYGVAAYETVEVGGASGTRARVSGADVDSNLNLNSEFANNREPRTAANTAATYLYFDLPILAYTVPGSGALPSPLPGSILDSGTTLSLLQSPVAQAYNKAWGATWATGPSYVDCETTPNGPPPSPSKSRKKRSRWTRAIW
ncbi:hypothetical protein B0H11DRAFT_2192949 [Mycena galericulata]|nr:hypothetical protein B0H11DRAFT_2192949 [Mycena galericulata]